MTRFVSLILLLCACDPSAMDSDVGLDTEVDTETDTELDTASADTADAFADVVVSYEPGDNAGFGQEGFPDIVLGPPRGGGAVGSLDVLSLGREGEIVLELDDIGIVDGPGIDLLVFENPFVGFAETGVVAVSEDGETWFEWPCDSDNEADGFPGCAGFNNVWSTPDNGIDPTDPDVAGGDGFDLAELGVAAARFVRVRDTGDNEYLGMSGGFDLDAIAVVHGELLE